MTYKTTSDLSQRRARQLWLADLQGKSWQELSPEEQRANLVRAKNAICDRLVLLPKNSEERRELGLRASDLDGKIRALRQRAQQERGWKEHFLDIARERLPAFQFKQWLVEANNRAAKAKAA